MGAQSSEQKEEERAFNAVQRAAVIVEKQMVRAALDQRYAGRDYEPGLILVIHSMAFCTRSITFSSKQTTVKNTTTAKHDNVYGPAVVFADGGEKWMIDGKLHREDGPAMTARNGTMYWRRHGVLHRDDGPAIIYDGGDRSYYNNGVLHREDGPALWNAYNGSYTWMFRGKRHRVGGPAEARFSCNSRWADAVGWYVDGILHRDDGPARITRTSSYWYKKGNLHRTGGPAVMECTNHHRVECSWYVDGIRHEQMIMYSYGLDFVEEDIDVYKTLSNVEGRTGM